MNQNESLQSLIDALLVLKTEIRNEIGVSVGYTKEGREMFRTFDLLIDQIETLPSFDSTLI